VQHGLGGVAFENETRERLRALGWEVETTAVTGDFGADLVARVGGEIVVVQCKDYGSPAGVGAVQEVYFARTHYGASGAVVVARNGFTRAAIRAAESAHVKLLSPGEIAFGGSLDRTPHRREIERRAAAVEQAERERQQRQAEALAQAGRDKFYSELWRAYDQAVFRHSQRLRRRGLAIKAVLFGGLLAILGASISEWRDLTSHQTVAKISLEIISVLFVLFLLRRRHRPPIRPTVERRGAMVKCDLCHQHLRVDYGRTGVVRCPHCTSLMGART
jgi:hypothetical protein